MKQKSGPDKAPAEQVLKDIRRQTRRQYSAEEKSRFSASSAAVFPAPLVPTKAFVPGLKRIATGVSPKQRKLRMIIDSRYIDAPLPLPSNC